uniref:Putative ovule protein n=1 Tax=Solanum chacoense TaxID=4108 RepID=A0A0V0IMU1_SOLCH
MMDDNTHSTRNASMQRNRHEFHNFSMNRASARNSTNANFEPVPVAPQPSKVESFWTLCNLCQIRYEYLKIHRNKIIMCPKCHQSFHAKEVGAPVKDQGSSFPWPSCQQQQGTNPAANESSASGASTASNSVQSGYSGFGSTVRAKTQQDQIFKKRDANGAQRYATTAKQAAHPGQPAGGISKRTHAETASSAPNPVFLKKSNPFLKTDAGFVPDSVSSSSKADRLIKKRRTAELKCKFQGAGMINDMAAKGGSSQGNIHGNENGVLRAERVAAVGSNKPRSSMELSNLEIRNMLMKKARMEINKKLKEWSTTAASRTSSKKEKEVEMKKQIIKNDLRRNKAAHDVVMNHKILRNQENLPVFSAPTDLESEAKSMTVPDPDFHNFDKDRTEQSFHDKQVWSAYDNDDGMTRYYALIHKVISRKPFKVQLSWLNSRNTSELGPMNWIGSGFLKTCGNFRIGRHEVNMTLNSFSHKVKWVKGAGGVIQIFPRKGDVWALYRHWSPQWNELTPDDMIHNYDMVEVLGDYTEKEGVTVAPLVKVAGFSSVFRQHLDPKYLLHIPREEMFRFSHQVPSYLLTDQEAPNAPTGCWLLQPLELPRIMTDVEREA